MRDFNDFAADESIERLVEAYRLLSAQTDREAEGWIPRIAEVEGLSAEEIAVAHGTAIAAELLEVRVEDATSGLRYRARKAA